MSADSSESSSQQTKYTNSNLQANNININTKETTTIKGATIKAGDTLTLNSKNLEVASVQDSSKSKTSSKGASLGFGASGLSSVGVNSSNANSNSKQTLLTSLTGNKVDINTQEETRLRGATIAAVDADGKDNSNLTLKTDTLLASSLNNTHNSKSMSVGINVGGAVEDAKISNVGLDYSNDRTNSKTKTLATLGSGNIQIADKENSDTKMLNTDIANNEVDIYNISSHKGLKGELDTRLLTEDGRNQIAEDLLKSSMIVDTITQIVTNETVDVTDFFSNTAKENTTFEAIKEKIANDPALAKALSNPDLTPEQKEQMMDGVTDAVMVKLGYETHDNKLIATDEKGRDNKDIKGYHSLDTKNSYINETNIDNGNEGLVEVAGTEAQRSIDRQEGSTFNQSQEYRDDRSDFSQNVGTNISNYTNFALNLTGQDSMTNYNKGRVTTTPSIFNTVAANNAEFAGLDKENGDNWFLQLLGVGVGVFTYSKRLNSGTERAKQIAVETSVDAQNKFNKRGGGYNDEGDAWRHAEWNKRMTNELGMDRALIYSTGHEIYDNGFKNINSNNINESKMDIYNNFRGATSNKTSDQLLKDNDLIILKGKGKNYE